MLRRRLVYLLLAVLVVFWAGAFVAVRILVEHASALTVAFVRFVLTTAGLLVVMAFVRPERPRIEHGDRGKVAVLALTGVGFYHLALNYGEHFVSASVASLIVASMPVMVAILSPLLLDERPDRTEWAGILTALVGVAVLILRGTPSAELRIDSVGGAAVIAIAPVSWAVYTLVGKPLVPKYGALYLTTITMGVGTAMLALVALPSTVRDLPRLTLGDWGWLAFLAFACSVYGYTVWLYALQTLEASKVAAWVYLVPLVAIVWGAVLLDEGVTGYVAVGGVLVLAGVLLTERIAPKLAARRTSGRVVA